MGRIPLPIPLSADLRFIQVTDVKQIFYVLGLEDIFSLLSGRSGKVGHDCETTTGRIT
jgi:hypothetical protein